ncbi:MAG TPA: SprT family zinc-dependent metalloprotease [Alphaproteobacteria bacterium]|nr:SprT family zinc-dependent metalloprotease [Alphaproteobacteria bacterium]
MRVDNARQRVVLVAPAALARRHAMDFLIRHQGWLNTRLAQLPAAQPFADGATVPILGEPHVIHGDATRLRGLVSRGAGVVTVPGAPDHLGRKLTDFLKKEAKREIETRANAKATAIGKRIAGLSLRDTRSRWGSCSTRGRLAFSWRLILAPEWVLDYVVAHEVAHLKEMNHGPRFWSLCADLTETDPKAARAWLKQHGGTLHAYG